MTFLERLLRACATGRGRRAMINMKTMRSIKQVVAGSVQGFLALERLNASNSDFAAKSRAGASGRLDGAQTFFHIQHKLDHRVSGAPFRTEFPRGLVRDGEHCEHHNHGYRSGTPLEETPTEGPTRFWSVQVTWSPLSKA